MTQVDPTLEVSDAKHNLNPLTNTLYSSHDDVFIKFREKNGKVKEKRV